MSNGSDDWVQQGTPRQDSWEADPGEYGLEVSEDWDDYSSEQGIVAPPPPPAAAVPSVGEDHLAPSPAEAVPPVSEDLLAPPKVVPDSIFKPDATSEVTEAPAPPSDPAAEPMAGWSNQQQNVPEPPMERIVAASGPVSPEPVVVPQVSEHQDSLTEAEVSEAAAAEDPVAPLVPEPPAAAPEPTSLADEPSVEPEPVFDAAAAETDLGADAAAAVTAGSVAGSDTSEWSRPSSEPQAASVTHWPNVDRLAPADVAPTATEPAEVTRFATHEVAGELAAEAAAADVAELQTEVISEPEQVAAPISAAAVATSADAAETRIADAAETRVGEPLATAQQANAAEELAQTEAIVPMAAAAGTAAMGADLYRESEDTRELPVTDAETAQAALEEQLRVERQVREERLGVVSPAPTREEAAEKHKPQRRSTDGFFGSFGLFVLRLVTAAILAIIGYQILTPVDRAADYLSQTLIPEPRLVAWILGFTLGALALFLVIGLLQRLVGALIMLLGIASLALLRWGNFLPFVAGQEGFVGDRDLLLTAVGLLLLVLGGGAWGIDGAIRRGRARAAAK